MATFLLQGKVRGIKDDKGNVTYKAIKRYNQDTIDMSWFKKDELLKLKVHYVKIKVTEEIETYKSYRFDIGKSSEFFLQSTNYTESKTFISPKIDKVKNGRYVFYPKGYLLFNNSGRFERSFGKRIIYGKDISIFAYDYRTEHLVDILQLEVLLSIDKF